MQRLDRYREVVDADARRRARPTAATARPAELEAMREAQRARGEKTRYDGTLAPRAGQDAAAGARRRGAGDPLSQPARRRGRPGTTWSRARSRSRNHEIDDLVIVRADGMPTYNFASSSTTGTWRISHVFRGDEHVNNTPLADQHLPRARRAAAGVRATCRSILGDDGEKLSKRRGAVSVTAYEEEGYLPEAMVNYLARLGWSHGDEEIFTREQMVEWFDGGHLVEEPGAMGRGQARLGQRALHQARPTTRRWPRWSAEQLARRGIAAPATMRGWRALCALFKDRCSTTARAGRLARDVLRRRRRRRADDSPRTSPTACRPALADAARQARGRRRGTRPPSPRRSRRRWPRTG